MVSSLLPEMITNILSWLPVKDVLCCRSLSKPWCSIIDKLSFIEMHLKSSMEIYSNRGFVPTGPYSFCKWFNYNTDFIPPIDFVCRSKQGNPTVGTCNGLLAILNNINGDKQDIALWNPFTRRYKMLPELEIGFYDFACYSNNIYGFGYDPISDDIKFVRIIFMYKGVMLVLSFEVHIYSLKTKIWRRVDDFPYKLDNYNVHFSDGILVNYTLHWLLLPKQKSDVPELIVAFDLVAEKFLEVPLPDYENVKEFEMEMGTLGGKYLYLYYCKLGCWDLINSWEINIWVMKENSWTRLASLPALYSNIKPTIPFCYKGNQILFNIHNEKTLHLFDLETHSFGKLFHSVNISNLRPISLQSLVGLNDGDWEIVRNKKKWNNGVISPNFK
ncbi:hypothetical protein UlMin_000204 [Ulmus minor]